MPRNFLEGCDAADAIVNFDSAITLEILDKAITGAKLTPDSTNEEMQYLVEQPGMEDADSLTVTVGADAADACERCSGEPTSCLLGTILRNLE